MIKCLWLGDYAGVVNSPTLLFIESVCSRHDGKVWNFTSTFPEASLAPPELAKVQDLSADQCIGRRPAIPELGMLRSL